MKYIFCSSIYNMDDYEYLSEKSKIALGLADHNLNRNVIRGLDEVLGAPISLINNTPIPNWPAYPKIIFRKQHWSHLPEAKDLNCGFINFPVLKHLSRAITTFAAIRQAVKQAKGEPVTLLTYDLHVGACIAIRMARKCFSNLRTCVFMPDVPSAVLYAHSGGKITVADRMRAAIKMRSINQFDSYVFITEYLKDLIDVSKKPYAVVEGIYNDQQPPLPEATSGKKVIFYSGQLNPAYGMYELLDAFVELYREHPDHELWLCGNGKAVPRIHELEKTCTGIKYFGYVNGQTVRQLQSEATVLVNPRQNIDSFTKYSFPSKTMEYLASGRPVIGYKLDGIPEEYDPYIQYVEDNSIDALKQKLYQLCALPKQQRDEIGAQARAFILKHKNPRIMCQRIVEICEQHK
ncbi:MAG: glycosyltransferase [Oscillospiraceae bacterium]|nr:glycosyltransferase [Oscillospiraceae bacterium]